MANNQVTPVPASEVTATTRRGFATASFSFGLWGSAVFWWYPFGMAICSVGLVFGLISMALGIRGGKDGENLALYGTMLSFAGVTFSILVYRFMILAFEGSVGFEWLPFSIS